ncbi:MAG: sigma-70 family RNA polymerase sigma factor [bacterium]|nr:sigma-70 family RNA polymerase sigma factor [bacterium]
MEAGDERSEAELATELVRRIESGDLNAEGELVERYSRGLLYMLRRMTGDPGLSDDLYQETFQIVLERLRSSGLDEPERLAGFLRRTARNLFIGDYRKKARRQEGDLEDLPPAADPRPEPLHHVMLDEEAAIVRRVLEELQPERDRQVLYRYYLLEEEKESICDDLGLSSLHFNRVLHRARQRFKRLMELARRTRRIDAG